MSVEEELSHRLRQQELLAGYGLFVADRLDLEVLLLEACRVTADGLHTHLCKVLEWVREENYLLLRSGVGWEPDVVNWATMSAGPETPAGYALSINAPVLSDLEGAQNRFSTPLIMQRHGVKQSISVLIPTLSGPFGVLEVDGASEGRFTTHDINFVSSIGHLLGAAITRNHADRVIREHQAALEAANARQQMLAKEIHHRVKNGLQLVASLLSMQGRSTQQPLVRTALADAEMRVIAVARVYDHLSEHQDSVSIEVGSFLSELCASLVKSAPNHQLTFRCSQILRMSTDRAIYLGLIANELVTNAVKYAYAETGGAILVALETVSGGGIELQVSDHGVGMPISAQPGARIGLGSELSQMLAKLLGGRLTVEPAEPGARWILRVPNRG